MSWDQLDSACRAGKTDAGLEVHSLAQIQEIALNWRKYAGLEA